MRPNVKVAGRWRYLYRAVDQYGQVIDVLLSKHRDTAAARRFFIRALRHGPMAVGGDPGVTRDSDYLPLVQRLREFGKHVVGCQYAGRREPAAGVGVFGV